HRLVRDVTKPIGKITVQPVEFMGEQEELWGTAIGKIAKEMNAYLGQRHAEGILVIKDRIPVEWRKYTLLLPGTIWCYVGNPARRYDDQMDLMPTLEYYDHLGWIIAVRPAYKDFYKGTNYRLLQIVP
ncbi:hypothetical protein KJ903_04610, partial [Patescibacteria group bacterium]|nr:hypothetical protein [Patescibacteria group bacterium]